MHKPEDEMKQAAAFVYYEFEQFRWGISHLPNEWRCGTGGSSREEDAVVEVALLHARVLRDFFIEKRPLPLIAEAGIIARDFFDNPDEWDPPALTYLANERTRLNRSLMHLSYSRIDFKPTKRKEWDFKATSAELTDAWKEFLEKLPEERRAWFKDHEGQLWEP